MVLVILLRNFNAIDVFSKLSVVFIPINFLVLMIFIYFYFVEARREEDEFDILLVGSRTEKTPTIYSKILINEGRYITFFIWGAKITHEKRKREKKNIFNQF